MNCKNCQSTLQNDAKYCLHCGQSAANLNRPFLVVAKEMTHEILDVDGKLWLTLRTILTKPGKLTDEFNQGKRVKYTPPLRLYLVISIIFFIIFSKLYQVYDSSTLLTESMISYYSKAMFVIRVLWQGREAEETLDKIVPLWDWLFENYSGLLQADGEGYYDKEQKILKTE